MSRARVPAAVLRAEGSRHYSKDELRRREETEVQAPPADHVEAPRYLPASLKQKFMELAARLDDMGTFSALDADGLARYLLAEANYLRTTSRLTSALNVGNLAEADRLTAMQDRFFRQCRAAGADLGLTGPGRCRMTLPCGRSGDETDPDGDLYGD